MNNDNNGLKNVNNKCFECRVDCVGKLILLKYWYSY